MSHGLKDISKQGWRQFIDDMVEFFDNVELLCHAVRTVEVKITFRDGTDYTTERSFHE